MRSAHIKLVVTDKDGITALSILDEIKVNPVSTIDAFHSEEITRKSHNLAFQCLVYASNHLYVFPWYSFRCVIISAVIVFFLLITVGLLIFFLYPRIPTGIVLRFEFGSNKIS
jgi:hypothetical protein